MPEEDRARDGKPQVWWQAVAVPGHDHQFRELRIFSEEIDSGAVVRNDVTDTMTLTITDLGHPVTITAGIAFSDGVMPAPAPRQGHGLTWDAAVERSHW